MSWSTDTPELANLTLATSFANATSGYGSPLKCKFTGDMSDCGDSPAMEGKPSVGFPSSSSSSACLVLQARELGTGTPRHPRARCPLRASYSALRHLFLSPRRSLRPHSPDGRPIRGHSSMLPLEGGRLFRPARGDGRSQKLTGNYF